jgi:hypothetical protein
MKSRAPPTETIVLQCKSHEVQRGSVPERSALLVAASNNDFGARVSSSQDSSTSSCKWCKSQKRFLVPCRSSGAATCSSNKSAGSCHHDFSVKAATNSQRSRTNSSGRACALMFVIFRSLHHPQHLAAATARGANCRQMHRQSLADSQRPWQKARAGDTHCSLAQTQRAGIRGPSPQ